MPNDSINAISPVKLFISYAHRDEELRLELNDHLSNLRRQGLIADWHDRRIEPGQEWTGEIDEALKGSQVILLLISPRFMASDYCYAKEMLRAIERHEAKDAIVNPIILSACDWQEAPFSKLQALPKDAKPIKNWADRDEAWLDVVRGLRRVIERLANKPPSKPSELAASMPAAATAVTPPQQTGSFVELDFNQKQLIVDALLRCESLATPASRDQIILSLRSAISARISRHQNSRQDVLSVVNTCLQFESGLKEFLEIVGRFEGETTSWGKLQAVLFEITPVLARR